MLRPKPNIERLIPAAHGGINYTELEEMAIPPESIIDFSVSLNPFGPPPGVREALSHIVLDRYPDSEATELRAALAEKLNLSPGNLLIGSGSTELIRLAATAYLGTDDLAIIPQPTYADYEIACCIAGAQVLKPPAQEEAGFRLNTAEIVSLIRKHQPRGLFLCNPNNPTGQYLSRQTVEEILSFTGETLVVLDEAYIAFTENAWESINLIDGNNLIVLRSMTKDYALAGLRLGYAIAAEPIISVLSRLKPPWNVNSAAQVAGVIALKADGYLEESWRKMKEAKEFLVKELTGLGFQPLPSQTNFFLVKVGDATGLRHALLKKGILVRDCASLGLPDYIRLAPRAMPECQRLIAAMKELCQHES